MVNIFGKNHTIATICGDVCALIETGNHNFFERSSVLKMGLVKSLKIMTTNIIYIKISIIL